VLSIFEFTVVAVFVLFDVFGFWWWWERLCGSCELREIRDAVG
jgi:hypothetical protein